MLPSFPDTAYTLSQTLNLFHSSLSLFVAATRWISFPMVRHDRNNGAKSHPTQTPWQPLDQRPVLPLHIDTKKEISKKQRGVHADRPWARRPVAREKRFESLAPHLR